MSMQVAKTIQSQISTRELWAIGAKNFRVIPGGVGHFGGLNFKASLFGSKPCSISITLNTSDLYNVDLFNSRGTPIKSIKDIFCEDLEYTVVSMVEDRFKS